MRLLLVFALVSLSLSLSLSACAPEPGSGDDVIDPDPDSDSDSQPNGDVDTDEDGLTDAREAELGTDPDNPDSDDDGLRDGEEIDAGTDPLDADTDDDGLDDREELRTHSTDPLDADSDDDDLLDGDEVDTHGTDPLDADSDDDGLTDGAEVHTHGTDPASADTDTDGFDDGAEVDWGSDPAAWRSFPWGNGVERWPDNADKVDTTVGSSGWGIGDRVPDFGFVDQYGNTGRFHQLYGNVVMLDLSAGWCGPCRATAQGAQAMYEKHGAEGFFIFHMMIDDNRSGGGVTDPTFLASWASEYGLSFPVVADSSNAAWAGFSSSGLFRDAIPFLVLFDRDLVVVQASTGTGSETRLESTAIGLLGE